MNKEQFIQEFYLRLRYSGDFYRDNDCIERGILIWQSIHDKVSCNSPEVVKEHPDKAFYNGG